MLRKLMKWGLKAVGGLVANLVLLTIWVDVVGLPAWVAIAPNFAIISCAGYLIANRYIWADGVSPTGWRAHAVQYAGMQSATLAGKAGNYLLYVLLLPAIDYRLAWVVGAVLTFLLSFAGNHWWWTRSGVAEST